MAIWLVARTDSIYPDEYDAFVVCAATERVARELAARCADYYRDDEAVDAGNLWLAPPTTATRLKSRDKAGVILGSFNAG